SVMATVRRVPGTRLLPVWLAVLNPVRSTVTVYDPTGMEGNAYSPVELVFCFSVTPVASFTTVTAAPATTAPERSKTVPLSREVEVWPMHLRAHARIRP